MYHLLQLETDETLYRPLCSCVQHDCENKQWRIMQRQNIKWFTHGKWEALLMRGRNRIFKQTVGIAQSVQRLATSWTACGSNAGGGEIFRARADQSWGPPSLLHNFYRLSFQEVKRPERGVNHPPLASAEVKERVAIYLYSSSRPSWPVSCYLLHHLRQFVTRRTWYFGNASAIYRLVLSLEVLASVKITRAGFCVWRLVVW